MKSHFSLNELWVTDRPHGRAVAATDRLRPTLLTAAAASLALTPLARAASRKPTAYARMGGIIVGAVLALQFLLALYVTWFRVKAPDGARTV